MVVLHLGVRVMVVQMHKLCVWGGGGAGVDGRGGTGDYKIDSGRHVTAAWCRLGLDHIPPTKTPYAKHKCCRQWNRQAPVVVPACCVMQVQGKDTLALAP
jgi:hypothetical protein